MKKKKKDDDGQVVSMQEVADSITNDIQDYERKNLMLVADWKRRLGISRETEEESPEIAELRALDAKINEGIKMVLDPIVGSHHVIGSDEDIWKALSEHFEDSPPVMGTSEFNADIARYSDDPNAEVIQVQIGNEWEIKIGGANLITRVRKIYNIAVPTAQIETVEPAEPTMPTELEPAQAEQIEAPPEDMLSDLGAAYALKRAVLHVEGADSRLARLQATGASNSDISDFLSHEFGSAGGFPGPACMISYKGGKSPSLTIRRTEDDVRRKLEGAELIELARIELDIPMPFAVGEPREDSAMAKV